MLPELFPGLPIIGWREWLALPDLGIRAVKAKVDTGARSSALHAFDIELFERDGRPMVRFRVHPWQGDQTETVAAEAPLAGERLVRNSGGIETVRPAIVTDLELAGRRWPIELTLTARDAMGFRMLLGREAVRQRFLVHPGRSYLTGKRPAGVPRPPRRRGGTP
ncbi:MAG TPA: RimK/LysX family protein [Pirellulales bacterium]|nr:RimK/LysX family protein [Pirellulales bacterium]